MMPVQKFLAGPTMSMPGSIFTQTIAGDWPQDDDDFENDRADQDIHLEPDFSTLSIVPWEADPTAQLIHDAYTADGRPVEIAPRQVLRRVIELYRNRGWVPVVAPEIEFYLVKPNTDPDYPLEPPTRPLGPAGVGAPVLFDRRGQRIRRPVRRHLRFLRGAGARDRHADPRGRRGADGDQPAPRRSADTRRPGVPVQAHHPRGGAAPRHVRHLHGQADDARAGLGDAHPPVGDRHRRPAPTSSPTRPATRHRSSSPSSAARRNTCRR